MSDGGTNATGGAKNPFTAVVDFLFSPATSGNDPLLNAVSPQAARFGSELRPIGKAIGLSVLGGAAGAVGEAGIAGDLATTDLAGVGGVSSMGSVGADLASISGSSGAATGLLSPGGTDIGGIMRTAKTISTVVSGVSSLAQAAAGISAASAAKKKGVQTDAPQIAAPITMPISGSGDTLNAMRSNIQEQLVRRGRAATILTSPDSGDKLGS